MNENISKCSFCKNPLTDKELKYGKTLLFSLMCNKCYKEYQKELSKWYMIFGKLQTITDIKFQD